MKPEAQRIAIAEVCGKRIDRPATGWHDLGCNCRKCYPLPDYPNDLNAMHEAESVLNRGSGYHNNGGYGLYLVALDHDVSATAAKRAEALLRTLNLWTE